MLSAEVVPVPVEKNKAINMMRYLLEALYTQTKFLKGEERALQLTQYAIDKGYINPRPALLSKTLLGYSDPNKNDKVPWWIIKSSLDILMMLEWKPVSLKGWTSFTYAWLRQNGPFKNTQDVINSLPKHIDKEKAKPWFELIEDRYQFSEKTKPFSHIVGFDGEQVTEKQSNHHKLKESFIRDNGFTSWEDAETEGYKVVTEHLLETEQESINHQFHNQHRHSQMLNDIQAR